MIRARTCTVLIALAILAACRPVEPSTDRPASPASTPTAGSFVALAPDVHEPCGIAASPGDLWVLACSGSVVRVPLTGGARTTTRVEGDLVGLDGIASGDADSVWVSLAAGSKGGREGSMSRIDAKSAALIGSVSLGSSIPIHATFAAGRLWVGTVDGKLFSLDGAKSRQIASGPPLVWVLAADDRLYTVADNGDVTERALPDGTSERTHNGVLAESIAAAAGLGSVWLANDAGVVRLDLGSGRILRVAVDGTVNDIEGCGGSMWFSQADFGLRSVDASGSVRRSVQLSPGARYLRCLGARLWILTEDGRLGSIDPQA